VSVLDTSRAVRWTTPVWRAGPVAWSVDDRTLFVAAEGSATSSLDAATGTRIAMRCGWGFGLYDRDVASDLPPERVRRTVSADSPRENASQCDERVQQNTAVSSRTEM
jgi:hypothetical protein